MCWSPSATLQTRTSRGKATVRCLSCLLTSMLMHPIPSAMDPVPAGLWLTLVPSTILSWQRVAHQAVLIRLVSLLLEVHVFLVLAFAASLVPSFCSQSYSLWEGIMFLIMLIRNVSFVPVRRYFIQPIGSIVLLQFFHILPLQQFFYCFLLFLSTPTLSFRCASWQLPINFCFKTHVCPFQNLAQVSLFTAAFPTELSQNLEVGNGI